MYRIIGVIDGKKKVLHDDLTMKQSEDRLQEMMTNGEKDKYKEVYSIGDMPGSLAELCYDCEYVFPNPNDYTPALEEEAKRLTMNELSHLMMEEFGTFECSHHEWERPVKSIYTRAPNLAKFMREYALGWMDQ